MRRLFPFCLCLLGLAIIAQADPPATCSLSNTVRDRSGKPLVGVRLTLMPSGHIAMTDEKGAAVFRNLPPGPCTVSFAPVGYYPVAATVTLSASAMSSIDFKLEKSGVSNIRINTPVGGSYQIIVPPVPPPAIPPPPEYLLTPPVPPGSGPAWRAAQEDVLREAMFRYLIDNSNHQGSFSVCYLSVGIGLGQDPTAALLKRLRGSSPPVQAASALRSGSKKWTAYRLAAFQWGDNAHVKIEATSSQSNVLSSVYLTLTCTLRNGWWVISDSFGLSA